MKPVCIYGIIVLLLGVGIGVVFAHCPEEGLRDSGSFFTGTEQIFGSASVSNLTYWPFGVLGQAYISSDHAIYAHSYIMRMMNSVPTGNSGSL